MKDMSSLAANVHKFVEMVVYLPSSAMMVTELMTMAAHLAVKCKKGTLARMDQTFHHHYVNIGGAILPFLF